MNPRVWPMVFQADGKFSIPDELWLYAWQEMERSGRVQATFYSGGTEDFRSFLGFMKNPANHPVMVIDQDEGVPRAIAWLNNFGSNCAHAHFSFLGPFARSVGQVILDYWGGFGLLRVILGLTPATNERALKTIRILGFKAIGEIPDLCRLHYEGNKLVPGVISYYHFGGKDNGRDRLAVGG